MASIGIQSSKLENFIEEAYRASNNGKKRVIVDKQSTGNPNNITWKVETSWEAIERRVSSSPITKQQDERFVAVLDSLAQKTGALGDQQVAKNLRDRLQSSPTLDAKTTAIALAYTFRDATPRHISTTSVGRSTDDGSGRALPNSTANAVPNSLRLRKTTSDESSVAYNVVNVPKNSVNERPAATVQSAQDLFDSAFQQFSTGVNLNNLQINLNDLGKLDYNFKINGIKLRDLVDPRTGKLPLRTALIAYLLQFPNEKIALSGGMRVAPSTAVVVWLGFTKDPDGTSGVNDQPFNKTRLSDIFSKLLARSGSSVAPRMDSHAHNPQYTTSTASVGRSADDNSGRALPDSTADAVPNNLRLRETTSDESSVADNVVNVPKNSVNKRPTATVQSAQDLFDSAFKQFSAGVDLNSLQVDLNDLGRLDYNFKINGIKLLDLVDPKTGKLPLRTAFIAYLLQFPNETIGPPGGVQITSSIAAGVWLSFTKDPDGTSGVGDKLFDETKLTAIFSRLLAQSGSSAPRPSSRGESEGARNSAPTIALDIVNTKYGDLRAKILSVYPEVSYLPQRSQQRILNRFIEQVTLDNLDQIAVPRQEVDPRLPVVLDQVSILISDLRDEGIEGENLGLEAENHLDKALLSFRENPNIKHIRLSNLLLDSKSRPDEIQRLNIYTPGPVHNHPKTPQSIKPGDDSTTRKGKGRQAAEHKERLLALDPENTLVIGNGGAGAAGLIQHLAKRFQTAVTEQGGIAPTIVWRFGDSNQNFDVIKHEDLAITYEPLVEQKLLDTGQLAQVKPVFFNHLELIAPRVLPFQIETGIQNGQSDDPIKVLTEIITKSIGLNENGEPKKTYFSRYNASAVGTKDEVIFRKAIKTILASKQRFSVLRKAGINVARLNEEQIEAALYRSWITHVVADRGASVIDAVRISDDLNLFHLNDRAILLGQSVLPDRWLTRTPNKIDATLLNPAQLIGAKHSLTSPQSVAFATWLTSEAGQKAVVGFRLQALGSDWITQPYNSVEGATFDELTAVAEDLEVGTEIDKIWRSKSTQY